MSAVYAERRLGLERVQTIFAHPIHHGLYHSVILSLVFVGLRGILSASFRWAAGSLLLVSGLLSLSSGAFLAMIMQLFLIGWSFALDKNKSKWKILLFLFFVAYIFVELASNRSAIRVFMSYATFSPHTAYWRAILFDWGLAIVLGSSEKNIV